MAEDRYPKEDILNVPYLAPERDYRSEGNSEEHVNYPTPDKPNRTLETLDNLDGVIRMADLLPAELGAIIKDITNVLSVDTQGKIIIDLMNPVPTTPETTEPGKPESGGGTYIYTPGDGDKNDGDYIDDIFSSEPEFTIQVDSPDSLITLARRAYKQDDLDIKEHYTSRMTQLSARFYQVMSTLAVDANMPDYSYLMQDFDGTAVTTSDPNQQHLIDNICKNQILYDQKLRQMNLIHTAENTLIMTRAMTAAEGQRERYLSEKYKKNLDDIPSSLSNSLLEKSREEANKKYKDSAYNMYKYLDSATKFTNSLLNLKIDNAAAKAQLANTGSDIYAITPPPAPTPDNVDDNYDTVVKQQQAGDKFVKDQSKDSKNASELDNGIGGGGGNLGASAGVLGGGNVDPLTVFNFLRSKGYNAIAACGIMGNIQQESGFNSAADNGSGAYGLCQWMGNRWNSLCSLASSTGRSSGDAGVQLDFLWQELQDYNDLLPSNLNSSSSASEAAQQFEASFERSGGSALDNRMSYAEAFYQEYSR